MKVTNIEKTIEKKGIWVGRTVVKIVCDQNTKVNTGMNLIIENVRKLQKKPRYIIIEGDVMISDNRIELFKLIQYFWTWYKTRGLEKILIRCDGVADITNFLYNSVQSREHFISELTYTNQFSKKNITENRFSVSDYIAFVVGNAVGLKDLFNFLQIIADDFLQVPCCVIKISNPAFYVTACNTVANWVSLNEIYDIRTIKD